MRILPLLFTAILLMPAMAKSESELPVQSRPIDIYDISDGYSIAFDNSPLWSHEYEPHGKAPAFIMQTPDKYYPPATVVVRFHKGVKVTQDESYFKEVALGAIETSAANHGRKTIKDADLQPATYRQLKGFSADYTSGSGKDQLDNRVYMTRNSEGQLMSMVVSTLPGKLDHIDAATRRIFDNIKFPDKSAKTK